VTVLKRLLVARVLLLAGLGAGLLSYCRRSREIAGEGLDALI
jgi:hypothetical protein